MQDKTADPSHRWQGGISTVEILLGLALSLILTLVISQIYLGSKQSYRLQEAQSRLQENGRFAVELLKRDIRRAGNLGCPSIKKTPVVIASPTPNIVPETAILGYNANATISAYPPTANAQQTPSWAPTAPSGLSAVAGTDILGIQFAEPCGGRLQAKVEGMTENPVVTLDAGNTCRLEAVSDELILSDCGQVEIFRADAINPIRITGTTNNTQSRFTYTHDVDAEVMPFRSRTYFIRNFNGEPSLYRQENTETTPTPQPILEGVEDMQILYGIDQDPMDGSVDQYLTANNAAGNWARVVAMRIDLVLRSTGAEGDGLTSDTTKACNGVTVTDRRLRRCYSVTVNLRNPRM